MIPELSIVKKAKYHRKKGYELPIVLLNGRLYRVYPTVLGEEHILFVVSQFSFQKGCEYLLFQGSYYFGSSVYTKLEHLEDTPQFHNNSFKDHREKVNYKIERLERLIEQNAKLVSVVGKEKVFYQLILIED